MTTINQYTETSTTMLRATAINDGHIQMTRKETMTMTGVVYDQRKYQQHTSVATSTNESLCTMIAHNNARDMEAASHNSSLSFAGITPTEEGPWQTVTRGTFGDEEQVVVVVVVGTDCSCHFSDPQVTGRTVIIISR